MSWNNLELVISTLEAETVNKVYENIAYLKSVLEEKGYTVGSITNPSVSYSTPIALVRGKLQTVENDVDAINAVIESLNYDGSVTIGSSFVLADYQRWVLILNDLYDIIVNGRGEWGMMTLTLEDGNPDAQDTDGNDIYIRGDRIV